MKRVAVLAVLALFSVSTASADVVEDISKPGKYGMGGCGLGSMVFESNTKGSQILAATTNGSFGTQTFGISSGTSHCTTSGVVAENREQEAFVEVNMQSLEREAASGGGEYLAALGTLLGCDAQVQPQFFHVMQDRFETIFPPEDGSAKQVLQNMKSELRGTDLAQSCHAL